MPYIFNIQKFSVHDGPGIRTTVFFKGCPLRCQWCHNPESQKSQQEIMRSILKAGAGNGTEPEVRNHTIKQNISDGDNNNIEYYQMYDTDSSCKHVCDAELQKIVKTEQVGKEYSIPELVKTLKKDQIFYDQSGGGVTLSGGEVMAQDMDYILELVKALDRQGISIVVDTCGYAAAERFAQVLPYTELFLYDLKMMDDEKHQKYTGVSNQLILDNLKFLSDQEARIELRMIMVPGVNMSEEDISGVLAWLKGNTIKLEKITLLPYHDFGRDKYRKLARECTQNFEKPSADALDRVKKMLEAGGYAVDIHQ